MLYLIKIVKGVVNTELKMLGSDLVGYINSQHKIALGYDGYKDYEKTLNSITTEDLKKFAKSLLKQGNEIEVSMVGVSGNE